MSNIEFYKQAAAAFDEQAAHVMANMAYDFATGGQVKRAFAPGPPPAGPAMGPPPGPDGGPPPHDGGMPPGPLPPDGGAPPPPPGPDGGPPPPDGGGMPPQLEAVLGDLSNGVQGMAKMQEQQQSSLDQIGKRMLDFESKIGDLESRIGGFEDTLKGPMPVEDGPEEPGPGPKA